MADIAAVSPSIAGNCHLCHAHILCDSENINYTKLSSYKNKRRVESRVNQIPEKRPKDGYRQGSNYWKGRAGMN